MINYYKFIEKFYNLITKRILGGGRQRNKTEVRVTILILAVRRGSDNHYRNVSGPAGSGKQFLSMSVRNNQNCLLTMSAETAHAGTVRRG